VQFFWSLMNLPLTVADQYLHKSEDELMWIRTALRTWRLTALRMDQTSSLSISDRMQFIMNRWIMDQSRYFSRTGLKNKKQLKVLKTGSTTFLYIAGGFAFLRIFIGTQQAWILAATGIAAALGALIKGYIQRRALSEHLKQYSRMAEIYSLAEGHAASFWERGDAVALIQELGKESLAENAEWVLLHRDRRVTFPTPKYICGTRFISAMLQPTGGWLKPFVKHWNPGDSGAGLRPVICCPESIAARLFSKRSAHHG